MRKIAALFAALVAVLIFIPASPATALEITPAACAAKSGLGYDVNVCVRYEWKLQKDGTGVRVENVNLYVTRGCGDLEGQAFDSAVTATNGNAQGWGPQFSCNAVWDLELNGPDNGAAQVLSEVPVNVNNAPDFVVNLVCDIRPNNPDDCYGWVV